MVVLLDGSPISTEELWSSVRVTIRFLVTSLTNALLPQFGRATSSRNRFCGSTLLPFKNDGGQCVLVDFKCCRYVLVPFPRSVPRYNSFDLMAQFQIISHFIGHMVIADVNVSETKCLCCWF